MRARWPPARCGFDAWHDLAQLGGGSDQGLRNPLVTNAQWEYTLELDPAAEPGMLWIQCRGVDVVYVSGRGSQQPYKDSLNPEEFAGVPPVTVRRSPGQRDLPGAAALASPPAGGGYEPSGLPSPFIGER